jgi:uncharacterized protein DUF2513
MERDMDLIRQLLFEIREKSSNDRPLRLTVDGFSDDQISYHVELLVQAGFVRATDMSKGRMGKIWLPISLTWSGHEFLDVAADDTMWDKAKAFVSERAGSITFELLKTVLVAWAKEKLHLKD